ncbi:MAG: ribonuclease HII [bacterium]
MAVSHLDDCPASRRVEQYYFARGYRTVCGVDEAGRGPLAGPVVAAAVIFSEWPPIAGITDSKRLSAARREKLFGEIMQVAYVATGEASSEEIDVLNILQASLLAMTRAVSLLSTTPDIVLVDGLYALPGSVPSQAIVKGDAKVHTIAAASIVAKVTRDHRMLQYEDEFPGYGFARHKGYPTREHLQALARLGPTPIHRKTFRGVLPPR